MYINRYIELQINNIVRNLFAAVKSSTLGIGTSWILGTTNMDFEALIQDIKEVVIQVDGLEGKMSTYMAYNH